MTEVNRRAAIGLVGLTGAAAITALAPAPAVWAAPILKAAVGVPQAVASGPSVYFELPPTTDGTRLRVGHLFPADGHGPTTLYVYFFDGYAGMITVNGPQSSAVPAGTTINISIAHIDRGSTKTAPRLLFEEGAIPGFTATGFGTALLVLTLTSPLRGGQQITFSPPIAYETGTYIDPEPAPQYRITATLEYANVDGSATLITNAQTDSNYPLQSGKIT